MSQHKPIERYLVLYAPWALSNLLSSSPTVSYCIAWLGSSFIFFLSFSGWVRPLPADKSWSEQFMRPLFIIQIIFAGYTCCTSIFYFINLLGYGNLDTVGMLSVDNSQQLVLTAQCQRYYCLGHAALATGLLAYMKYPVKSDYDVPDELRPKLLVSLAIFCLILSTALGFSGGLSQLAYQLSSLGFIAATLSLAISIPRKEMPVIALGLLLYLSNLSKALLSGYKEPIIISVMILGIFLYPTYKKAVTYIFVPLLLALFFVLPTYNQVFRENAWIGDSSAENASNKAVDALLSVNEKSDTNWSFLVYRLSEIDMFTRYIRSTPEQIPFYGLQLTEQAVEVLVPRIIWPGKPVTEDLVMERVYQAGIVSRTTIISAKPPYIVDAYLSGGSMGIWIALFIYGAGSQLIARLSEKLFGSYLMGSALVFGGLFQILWRGLSFEFVLNAVFWSIVSMYFLYAVFRFAMILKPR